MISGGGNDYTEGQKKHVVEEESTRPNKIDTGWIDVVLAGSCA